MPHAPRLTRALGNLLRELHGARFGDGACMRARNEVCAHRHKHLLAFGPDLVSG